MGRPQQDASGDALTTRIGQAVMLHRAGDREEARNRLGRLWEEAAGDGGLLDRCTIAHYMADTQDDPADRLDWDRRALRTADALVREGAGEHPHAPAVRALYPSLHLSLAADHVRLGDPVSARRELARARGAAGGLPDDDHGAGIRAAIRRLEARLTDDPRPPGTERCP